MSETTSSFSQELFEWFVVRGGWVRRLPHSAKSYLDDLFPVFSFNINVFTGVFLLKKEILVWFVIFNILLEWMCSKLSWFEVLSWESMLFTFLRVYYSCFRYESVVSLLQLLKTCKCHLECWISDCYSIMNITNPHKCYRKLFFFFFKEIKQNFSYENAPKWKQLSVVSILSVIYHFFICKDYNPSSLWRFFRTSRSAYLRYRSIFHFRQILKHNNNLLNFWTNNFSELLPFVWSQSNPIWIRY